MNPAEAYLAELRDIRASGAAVPETSGYGALANLLNEVGAKLKPKVRCLINLQNAGAGIPDGGLFTASQFPKGGAEPLGGQLPARGAIEVKPVGQDAHAVAGGEQVRRYLEKYRQVLVTTYREFVPVRIEAHEHELAVRRHQHLAVLLEVAAHLLAAGDGVSVLADRLGLDGAAAGELAA